MRERAARLRKLMGLLEKRWKIETANCARVEALLRNLNDEERRLAAYLSSDSFGAQLFPDVVLRRLRAANEQERQAEARLETLKQSALTEKKRAKRVEKAVERIETAQRTQEAADTMRKSLDRLSQKFEVSLR